ncbi:MAG: hypothetical protein ACPG5Q_14220, partial [Paracoccaceae bacterium]
GQSAQIGVYEWGWSIGFFKNFQINSLDFTVLNFFEISTCKLSLRPENFWVCHWLKKTEVFWKVSRRT